MSERKLTQKQEEYALAKIDKFYESVGVKRLDKPDGFWLQCEKCGSEWEFSRDLVSVQSHWVCPKRCNIA